MSKEYTLIGLTGPTGSGKTTVTEFLRSKGFGIVNADEISHRALEDKELIKALAEAFGEKILNPDGSINRRETAKAAFSTQENTEILNSLTHPVILKLAKSEFENLAEKGYSKIIFDAPTLFESGGHKLCDKIISVVANQDVRIRRILSRDNITENEALSRMHAQKPLEFYTDNSHYVIDNSTTPEDLRIQTERIAEELMNE